MDNELTEAMNMINSKAFPLVEKIDNEQYNYIYNCWGFVAYMADLINKLEWLDKNEIESLLNENCIEVNKDELQTGDIACYYECDKIIHTAFILNAQKGIILHKPGMQDPCIDQLYNGKYNYGIPTIFMRVKKQNP